MEESEWGGDFDPMADPEEQRHVLSVLDSFRSVLLEQMFTNFMIAKLSIWVSSGHIADSPISMVHMRAGKPFTPYHLHIGNSSPNRPFQS